MVGKISPNDFRRNASFAPANPRHHFRPLRLGENVGHFFLTTKYTNYTKINQPQKNTKSAKDFSLSASIPFSASDGEKVAKPDEVFPREWRGAGGEGRGEVSLSALRSLRSLAASFRLLPPDELHEFRHAQHARQLRRRVPIVLDLVLVLLLDSGVRFEDEDEEEITPARRGK